MFTLTVSSELSLRLSWLVALLRAVPRAVAEVPLTHGSSAVPARAAEPLPDISARLLRGPIQ